MKAIEYLNQNMVQEISGDRYHELSFFLGKLAQYALNKEKNSSKDNFEDMSTQNIFQLLVDELHELKSELFNWDHSLAPAFLPHLNGNEEKMIEELADVAGCCVGLLAKILKEISKNEKN